ncbi:MAG: hypothetical protein JSR78_04050 [Proteobacteria bacterium]|nr:hypothetical protein [Pseudomonadota bacterium]
MRRIRRDTAGGSEIAMMAVITKAMGAFLVLMIVLLPYYTSDPVAQRTADEATEQVDQAKKKLQEAQDKLKKGRLTDEEIDALLDELDEATRQLEEALLNIRQLKIQVDQLTSQVKRLEELLVAQEKEITALKVEIARLLAEIELLKRNQKPEAVYWNIVRLDWRGCTAPSLNLYITSNLPRKDGAVNPPPDRTVQKPFFETDKVQTEVTNRTSAGFSGQPTSGTITYMINELNVDELLTVYVKLLNPIPGGDMVCDLTASWSARLDGDTKPATFVSGKVSDREPYVLLVRLKSGERGSLAPIEVSAADLEDFQKAIAASRCEKMTCGLDDPGAKDAFAQAIVDRFSGAVTSTIAAARDVRTSGTDFASPGNAMLKDLGQKYANKQISFSDISKWISLLAASISPATRTVTPDERAPYIDSLRAAAAPDRVIDFAQLLTISTHFDAAGARRALEEAGIKLANRPEDEKAAQLLLDEAKAGGCDPATALQVGRLVAERRMPVEAAKALIKLLIDHQSSPPRDFFESDPARSSIVQEQLLQMIRPNNALFQMLSPSGGRVPPDLSMPLVSQIKRQ